MHLSSLRMYATPSPSNGEEFKYPLRTETSSIGLGLRTVNNYTYENIPMAPQALKSESVADLNWRYQTDFVLQPNLFESYSCGPFTTTGTDTMSACSPHSPPYFPFTPHIISAAIAGQDTNWYTNGLPTPSPLLSPSGSFRPCASESISPTDAATGVSHWSHGSLSTYKASNGQRFLGLPEMPAIRSKRQNTPCSRVAPNTRPRRMKAVHHFSPNRSLQSEILGCDLCSRTFDRRANLKAHRKTHTPERVSVSCDVEGCTKGPFGRRADMNRHMSTTHHGRRHVCEFCHKAFGRSDTLIRHIQNTCPRENEFSLELHDLPH